MRCKKCGGMLAHALTDVFQETYYECRTGLCELQEAKDPIVLPGRIKQCLQVYNNAGQIIQDAIMQYYSDGNVRIARVENGRFKK